MSDLEPGRIYPPPKWLGILVGIFFVLSVLGGIYVVASEFSSPHPPRSKDTKPWLDR